MCARRHDGVYNAKLTPFKRHFLVEQLNNPVHVTYFEPEELPAPLARALVRRLQQRPHGGRIANPIVNGLPERISPEQVNRTYAEAHTGLCLSAVEGAMYASAEYLLAGLPSSAPPAKGGREVFFDEAHCIIVDDTAEAVKAGVQEMIARAIPATRIRRLTLQRIEQHRFEAAAAINEAIAHLGIRCDIAQTALAGMPRTYRLKAALQHLGA